LSCSLVNTVRRIYKQRRRQQQLVSDHFERLLADEFQPELCDH
jgi:hypothetical protein